jgi:hypothetical protein
MAMFEVAVELWQYTAFDSVVTRCIAVDGEADEIK